MKPIHPICKIKKDYLYFDNLFTDMTINKIVIIPNGIHIGDNTQNHDHDINFVNFNTIKIINKTSKNPNPLVLLVFII